jgi:H+/gluconate symporter-like permease
LIKKYRLGKISLDKNPQIYNEAAQNIQITEEDQSLLQLHFSLTKEELLAVNFRLFYTKPAGIMMTAAGIVAPIAALVPGTNVELLVLSTGAGSLIASHVNDAGFWMFKEYFGLSVKETLMTWTALETIIAVAGLVFIEILNIFV